MNRLIKETEIRAEPSTRLPLHSQPVRRLPRRPHRSDLRYKQHRVVPRRPPEPRLQRRRGNPYGQRRPSMDFLERDDCASSVAASKKCVATEKCRHRMDRGSRSAHPERRRVRHPCRKRRHRKRLFSSDHLFGAQCCASQRRPSTSSAVMCPSAEAYAVRLPMPAVGVHTKHPPGKCHVPVRTAPDQAPAWGRAAPDALFSPPDRTPSHDRHFIGRFRSVKPDCRIHVSQTVRHGNAPQDNSLHFGVSSDTRRLNSSAAFARDSVHDLALHILLFLRGRIPCRFIDSIAGGGGMITIRPC